MKTNYYSQREKASNGAAPEAVYNSYKSWSNALYYGLPKRIATVEFLKFCRECENVNLNPVETVKHFCKRW